MRDDQDEPLNRDDLLFDGELPIKYYGSDDVVGVFADQVVISHLSGMFSVYFYQMQLPPVVGDPNSPDTRVRLKEELKDIPAKCVVRIVLTPMLMEDFLKALQKNVERFKRKTLEAQAEVEK